MCEASAFYKNQESEETLILKDVALLKPEEENLWFLVNIFGEQKEIHAKLLEINLLQHKIIFQKI
ncbi:RNA-binding protein [Thermodesulfobium narugense DSM 14796]|uniref:RNA-binding protein n=1 Tax=Thermodesulfobium narugense DSM 14796 TaxID=747365 RepID=M1E8B3_9BACT|nr:CooT family nickel-binding protein [Thermodesulfobium narugense]AEE14374.1 RNA-binding protein [Thermodesulfobium narugense DSM 14796]